MHFGSVSAVLPQCVSISKPQTSFQFGTENVTTAETQGDKLPIYMCVWPHVELSNKPRPQHKFRQAGDIHVHVAQN